MFRSDNITLSLSTLYITQMRLINDIIFGVMPDPFYSVSYNLGGLAVERPHRWCQDKLSSRIGKLPMKRPDIT